MHDLAVRAMLATENAARVTAGRTTYSALPYPEVGNQPSRTEKKPLRISPSQNVGMEAPRTLTVVIAESHVVPRQTAAVTPAGRPTARAMARLTEASSSEASKRVARSLATGSWLRRDRPRSPVMTRPR